jgi:exosome complex component RRP42
MNEDMKKHLIEALQKGVRFDGRKPTDYREISVETNVIKNAEGSARVKIGDTEVIAGVKMEVGKPYPDTPDEGSIMVGAELLPLSSPEFETGPPGIKAIELARVVDRGIRESKTLDLNKLCIEKGEKMWMVVLDVCSINDDGNLFDAASLAALAAMKDACFPEYDGEKVDYKHLTKQKLPLTKEPIEVTVWKAGDQFIVDPTPREEESADARLTVASTTEGDICAMQKGGDVALTLEDVEKMVDLSIESAKKLRSALK